MSLHKKLAMIVGGAMALAAQSAHAQAAPPAGTTPTLYVAATGGYYNWDRSVALNTPSKPYDSITHACQHAQPNDTIIVNSGTYTDAANVDGNSYLTIQPATGASVVLKANSTNDYTIVYIDGSDHILFTGFEIDGTGAGPSVNGVSITPGTNRGTGAYQGSDHIQIKKCKVHDAGGSGISSISNDTHTVGCDYITIYGNEIYNCLKTGQYRGSGISLYEDRNSNPSDTSWHSIIDSNKVHDNVNQYPITTTSSVDAENYHSDGNGIIIDTTQNGAYGGPQILVQNNVVYRNGGRGIHVFLSSNVTVLNNTVYQNDTDPYLQFGGGELSVGSSDNVLVSNNMVQGNGKAPGFVVSNTYGSLTGANVHFVNNTLGGASYSIPNANIDWNTTINFDWATVLPFVSPSTGNFHLKRLGTGKEVALNKGSNILGQYSWFSIEGVQRNASANTVDRGAYEQ